MFWLAKRVFRMFTAPRKEWIEIQKDNTSKAIVYLIILELLSLAVTISGLMLTGKFVKGTTSLLESISFLSVSSLILLVIALINAFIIFSLGRLFGATNTFSDGVKIIAYGQTPYLFSAILHSIWSIRIVEIVLYAYTLLLIWFGMSGILDCPKNRKPIVFLLTALLSSVTMISLFVLMTLVFV